MKVVNVNIQEGYPVYIGCNILEQLPQILAKHNIPTNNKLVCITDSNIAPLYQRKVEQLLITSNYNIKTITIPAGESSKNIGTLEKIIVQCLELNLDRQSVILSFGGGVVGDIAGFVASTYMRGIRYIHIPTTIIAHDSSIGGKVGVNHLLAKNVIGAFHQPQFVFYDVAFLKTLPMDERISGYAEVIKHAVVYSEAFFQWLKENGEDLISLNLTKVEEAIFRSCSIKASIVSCDEKENGLRMILNYGHTIGHALETVTDYKYYRHGEAVAIGMCGAAYLSEAWYGRVGIVKPIIELLTSFQLPTCFRDSYLTTQLLSIMKHDKKRREGKYTFVLSPEIGKAEVIQVNEDHIKIALRKCQVKKGGLLT